MALIERWKERKLFYGMSPRGSKPLWLKLMALALVLLLIYYFSRL